jgi:Protein of unknown function (DUF1579)
MIEARTTDERCHEVLASLAGDWEGDEQIGASPWTTPGRARGFHRLRLMTRGLTVVQDYEQRRGGAVGLTGHGVFSVDPESSDVLWWWFDDFGYPPLSPSRGRVGPDGVLVLEKATVRGRQRATFAIEDDVLIHQIAVAPGASTRFTPIVEASYQRQAGGK